MKSAVVQQPNEKELISRSRRGELEAFNELVMLFTPRLYRVVLRIASDPSEAEAIVQESFLRAWRNLHRFREEQPFFPYLVTIALNIGRDQWRKSRFLDFQGLESLTETLPDSTPGPEKLAENAELLDALAAAVDDLPPAYRAVIALRYDAGLSYAEIAKMLELPLNTVRTHLRRARQRLRHHLYSWK